MSGVWMRLPNGREEVIPNPDHVQRLLAEGGVEIADPTLPSVEATVEASDATQEDTPSVVENEPLRKRGRHPKQQ